MNDESLNENYENDEYESSRGTLGTAVTFLLIGLGAGAVIGLLFAPKSGRQMRLAIQRQYWETREIASGFAGRASDLIERGTGWANAARAKVIPLRRVKDQRS